MLNPHPLPLDLVSLVHHVELADAGWRRRAIESIFIATIHRNNHHVDLDELQQQVAEYFGLRLQSQESRKVIAALRSQGSVVQLPSGRLKLSEAAGKAIAVATAAGHELENRLRARFIQACAERIPAESSERLWSQFLTDLLYPLFADLGARIYEFISGERGRLDDVRAFRTFVSSFPVEIRESMRNLLNEIFDPMDSDVRSYFLSHLHARLLIDASNLGEKAMKMLSERIEGGVELIVFADTNFIFSLLGLNDGVGTEAASALLTLRDALRGRVSLKFYVLPITIDELRRTLIALQNRLSSIRPSRHMSRAIEQRSDVSSFARDFFKEAERTGWRMKADDYLEPYISNPVAILRAKGIELFNADLSSLLFEKKIGDELQAQIDFERRRYASTAKEVKAVEHDILLWYFVQGKRPAHFDSPLDAKYWVVTLDNRFLGFDSYKNRRRESVSTCLHPTILIEMLQFWLPRSEEYDIALFKGLRFMLPQSFDAAAEQVTLNILGLLSRFEGAEDLDEQTVAAVLMNKALRSRLKGDLQEDEEISLIREALLEEIGNLQERLKRESIEKGGLSAEIDGRESRIAELSERLERLQELRSSELRSLESDLRNERAKSSSLEDRLGILEADFSRSATRRKRRIFAATRAGGVLALLIIVFRLSVLGASRFVLNANLVVLTSESVVLLACIRIIERQGGKLSEIVDWPAFKKFCTLGTKLWLLAGGLALSLLSSLVYDIMKR